AMLLSQSRRLNAKHEGERVGESQNGVRVAVHCRLECSPEIVSIPHLQPQELNTEPIRRGLGLPPLRRDDRIAWIHDYGDTCGAWYGFLVELEAFLGQVPGHGHQPRHVPARPGQL